MVIAVWANMNVDYHLRSPNPNLHKKLFQAETFIENATNGFNRTLDGSRVLNQ